MELETHSKDPFSKLAPEVIGHIFEHCLPPESEPISLKIAPLLLVKVCRRWGEIAFGTPRLWQNIHLEGVFPGYLTAVLDLFLTKSGNLPLRITYPSDLGWYLVAEKNFTTRLLGNFHRVLCWQGRARLLFSYFEFIHGAPNTASSHIHAPLLKRLDLMDTSIPQGTGKLARKYRHNRIIAPNLQELHLDGSGVGFSIVNFSPESLKVLTGLGITVATKNCDLSFLCKTINLATLELGAFNRQDNMEVNFPSSVYLPNLKCLRLSITGFHLAEKIVSSLHCPAIEELTLDLTRDDPMPYPNVIDYLTRGQTPPLRSLSTNIFGEMPLSSYHRLDDVEELTLLFDLGEAAVQALMEKGEREFHLFPRLSSFTIQQATMPPEKTDAVLRLLKARCTMASGGTLTRARFRNCDFRKSDEARIRGLQKELEGKLTVDISWCFMLVNSFCVCSEFDGYSISHSGESPSCQRIDIEFRWSLFNVEFET